MKVNKRKHQISLAVIVLFASILIISCTKEEYTDQIGLCTYEILPNEEIYTFNANSDSTIVTTTDYGWWITGLNFGDTLTIYQNDIDQDDPNFELSYEFLNFKRLDYRSFQIKVKENTQALTREVFIGFQSGNCFDGIVVRQLAN